MKKSTALLAAALLTFSLTACGQNAKQSDSQNETVQKPAVSSESAEETEEEPASSEIAEMEDTTTDGTSMDSDGSEETENGGGKTLIVYYSAGGHTQKAADYIAGATGGDIFELIPAEPYSDEDLDYNDKNSRVVYEHDNPEARVIELEETTVPDWDSYDTVFIGYPIWWGQAPKIMYTFMESYDFTGKTIVPFCTSGSSGIGSSATNLAQVTSEATWLPGRRFAGNASQSTLMEWVNSLGLSENTKNSFFSGTQNIYRRILS